MKKEMSEEGAFIELSALCAAAEHCQYEMTEKMRRWGLSDEAQARVMEKLVKGRFVDDERYARAFVADKLRYNKWGSRKIEQALWQKRIDEDIRQRALSAISSEEYLAVLRPLLAQKRRSTRAASDYELNQKLVRFALSRGFTFDVIRQCLQVDDMDDED